ncbi:MULTISPECIES: FKBP-type peptidyl-prolyl cis-trans isomerase [unclassified Luteococcus]|uniref:FKBP-type peptidyl-prolyl cis-trans isomerase n=1 Tax=unclassified Luteococcus TaxID=2639923 RepID=UPI00313C1E4D
MPRIFSQTMTTPLRRAGVALLAVGLSASLAACGSKEGDDASASPSAAASGASSAPAASASGSASAAATPTVKPTQVKDLSGITVAPATVGKAPKVTAKWPLAIDKSQTKVLTPGTGETVAKGATVKVNYQGVNARDGKVFDSSFERGQAATFSLRGVVPGFTKAIEGQKLGSRVVTMMTAADGYADGNPNAGIQKGDNLVFVIDILETSKNVAPKAGLPTIKDDAQGIPTATMPKTAAPAETVVQPLVQAPGEKVTEKFMLQVAYRAWDWKTGKLLEDSYSAQQAPQPLQVSQLIPAMKKGLVGQTVGSRVMVVIPPKDQPKPQANSASPSATPSASTQTLVYVIDIQQGQAGA